MLCGLSIIRKAIANDNYGCGSRKVWPTLKSTRYGEAALHCYLAEFRLEEATEGIGGFLVVTGSKQEAISPIVRRLGNSTYLVSVYRFLSSGSERIKDFVGRTAVCLDSAIHQQREIGMAMEVDESWRNDHPLCIDRAPCSNVSDSSDICDLAVSDCKRTFVPRTARAIQDMTIDDHYVIGGLFSSLRKGHEWKKQKRSSHRSHDPANHFVQNLRHSTSNSRGL